MAYKSTVVNHKINEMFLYYKATQKKKKNWKEEQL